MITKLRQSHFFSHFTDDDLKRIEKISHIKKLEKNSIVFYRGDEPKYLYVLLEGGVRIFKNDPRGREITLMQEFAVATIAELASFERINYPASCETTHPSTLLMIEYEAFEREFLKTPEGAFAMIRSLSKKMRSLSNLIDQELVLNSEQKVAKYLVENQKNIHETKHTHIAIKLNMAPETLSRTLGKFYKEGLLSSRQPIEIADLDLLTDKYN